MHSSQNYLLKSYHEGAEGGFPLDIYINRCVFTARGLIFSRMFLENHLLII